MDADDGVLGMLVTNDCGCGIYFSAYINGVLSKPDSMPSRSIRLGNIYLGSEVAFGSKLSLPIPKHNIENASGRMQTATVFVTLLTMLQAYVF